MQYLELQIVLSKLRRALGLTQAKPVTIGTLIERNQCLVIHCKSCGFIAYVKPSSITIKANVELTALEQFQACEECGYSNSDGGGLLNLRLN
jgi:predicted nucleic-acid-binding Zn-ribbon protein